MSFGSNHHYLECIKAAYDFASGELLNLIKDKVWHGFCYHPLVILDFFQPYVFYLYAKCLYQQQLSHMNALFIGAV